MYTNNIFGTPKTCLNRTCRATLYKESHLGWIPKSAVEAYAIIRCSKCQDTFAIVQMYSDVHDYYEILPNNPKFMKPKGPISQKELRLAKKHLHEDNPLKTLMEGWVPGAGNPLLNDDE